MTAEFWIRKKNTGNKIAPATAKWLEFIGANEWNWLNVTSCRKVLLKCLAHLKYLYKICCCLGREFIFTTMRYFLRTWLENIAPQSTLWSHLSVYSYFAKSVSRRNFDTECSRICLAEKKFDHSQRISSVQCLHAKLIFRYTWPECADFSLSWELNVCWKDILYKYIL